MSFNNCLPVPSLEWHNWEVNGKRANGTLMAESQKFRRNFSWKLFCRVLPMNSDDGRLLREILRPSCNNGEQLLSRGTLTGLSPGTARTQTVCCDFVTALPLFLIFLDLLSNSGCLHVCS